MCIRDSFNSFTDYLIEKKFTYTSQTEKYYSELLEVAKFEGLDTLAKAEFEALKTKLIPDIAQNIKDNKTEISELLSLEIIKRYYYQKGVIEYSLRTDNELNIAKSILKNEEKYSEILKKSKK
jgi:carboxyl-terminal processing protease